MNPSSGSERGKKLSFSVINARFPTLKCTNSSLNH